MDSARDIAGRGRRAEGWDGGFLFFVSVSFSLFPLFSLLSASYTMKLLSLVFITRHV